MNSLSRKVRFGVFEADLATGELHKQGRSIPVQQQPFMVLAALLERAGEVVSRDELKKAVWPEDTFVDFDFGLNTAIKKIRLALDDSAGTPRFVETLPRRGYRFIAAVSWEAPCQTERAENSQAQITSDQLPALPKRERGVGAPDRRLRVWIVAGLFAAAAFAITFWARWSRDPGLVYVPVPLTAYEGLEHQPSFSPDARNIAFVWEGGKDQGFHIYTRPLGGGNPLGITQGPAMDVNPVWSPDGRRIAFVRISGESTAAVYVVPSGGGPEVQVVALRARTSPARSWVLLPSLLAWTPDGEGLVVADIDETGGRSSLFLAPLGGGPRRRLTTPDPGWSDSAPTFSPDHRSLAFIRSLSILDADIFVLPLDAGLSSAGESRRVSSLYRMTPGLTWTRDGREIIFASGQPGASRLWRVSVAGGSEARPLQFGSENVLWPTISSQGHLAYETSQSDTNIWRAPLRAAGEPQRWIASTRDDDVPQYSPDGLRILFLSKRSGNNEIWIANADGSSASQVTNLRASFIGWPHWSPDGSTIAFDSRHDQRIDVFSIGAAGGSPRMLTDGKVPCGAASYSRDGRWIYYHCIEAGARQIWRKPAQGGPPTPIAPGLAQLESEDGRYLYFARSVSGVARPLWRLPLEGGEAVKILPDVEPFNYAVTPDGIYFGSTRDDRGLCFIRFLHFASNKISTVVTYTGRPGPGMSVSPDGKWLLYSYDEQRNADLMLVEGFR